MNHSVIYFIELNVHFIKNDGPTIDFMNSRTHIFTLPITPSEAYKTFTVWRKLLTHQKEKQSVGNGEGIIDGAKL